MRAASRTVARARTLRKGMSLPEVLLWDCLRSGRLSGLRFRRQHPLGPYVLDFYCPQVLLAVEVDGGHHDLIGQMGHDAGRDRWLSQQGLRVIRVQATDILDGAALEGFLRVLEYVATGAPIPEIYCTRPIGDTPPPPPSAVPLPRFAGEEPAPRPSATSILPRLRGRGTAEGGGGGASNIRSASIKLSAEEDAS